MKTGGILETNTILREFHKESYIATENARSIETDIISHLMGLRGDLSLKIKEIRALSGDFKNSVEKERDATRKVLVQLSEAIQALNTESHSVVGKNEPYLARLQAERQVRRQLVEENHLHKVSLPSYFETTGELTP